MPMWIVPTANEWNGWTASAAFDVTRIALAVSALTESRGMATLGCSGRWCGRTALTLQPDGWVKAHTCSDRYDIHAKMEDRACEWVAGIRRYYGASGDTAVSA